MNITKLDCPSCGAALTEKDSKYICEYCGRELFIESKKLEAVSTTIAQAESKTQEVISTGSQSTQLELRKLQLTQELSMLEMQLSNLRSEKRSIGLAEKKTKAHKQQIKQIETEEANLLQRINNIQCILYPPVDHQTDANPARPQTVQQFVSNQKSQGMAFWLAALIGFFGAHRFYSGHWKLGLVYLFTFGIMGFGWIYDIFMIFFGKYKDTSGSLLMPMGKTARIIATIYMIFFVIYMIAIFANAGSTPPVAS